MESCWIKCKKCGDYSNLFETTICKNCETPLEKKTTLETKQLDKNGCQEEYTI